MRIVLLSVLATLLVLSTGKVVDAQTNNAGILTTNLSLGSSGIQVIALQKILNQDPGTRVVAAGPGSPGNETPYFGALTQNAVIRFQNKYASEVLAPAGLTYASGYVGSYTRTKLNGLMSEASNITPTAPIAASPPASTSSPQNPNLENLTIILADVDKVGAEQGLSSATLASVKTAVIERLSTTTDLRALFFKKANIAPQQSTTYDSSIVGRALAIVEQALSAVFVARHAQAAVDAYFGGAVLGLLPCDGDIWNIYLEPLPPLYPTVLSYAGGSQVFASYNIPFTTYLLGAYTPVPMAYCWLGYYPVPSEGMITPEVGSSALP